MADKRWGALIVAVVASVGATACTEIGEAVIGPAPTGPMTSVPAPQGPYVPADVDDPTVRQAAGVAVSRISKHAALTRIFSAESTMQTGEFYRMQIELTDRSIWEAVLERSGAGFEVLRLERIG